MEEEWKDINGYEGLYQISNLGRVKSLARYVKSPLKNQTQVLRKEKILKQYKGGSGYYMVMLLKNNKYKTKTVHRLVAETFLPNPNNYSVINHIDCNKTNNNIKNLEWCTQKHNIQESFRNGLQKIPMGIESNCSKKVNQYDLQGNFIKRWNCTMDIQRELGIANQLISACCLGKTKTSKRIYMEVFRWII